MPVFLNTRGRPTLAIAICARCSRKFPRDDLIPDPNSPGLMCCREDVDQFDPYRLAPRAPDKIALEWARPDVPLSPGPMIVPVLPLQAGVGVDPGSSTGGQAEVLEVGTDMVLQVGLGLVLKVGETAGTALVESGFLDLLEAYTGTGIAAADPVTTIQQPETWAPGRAYSLGAQIVPVDPVGTATVGLLFQTFTCIYPGVSGSTAPTWPTLEGIAVEDGEVWWISAGLYLP